jgi:protein TonB
MHTMDANRILPEYELKSELARLCLPSAERDPNRRLAWVNSICVLFLIIGLIGVKPPGVAIKPVPPLDPEVIPVLVEPATPPPQAQTEPQEQEPPDSPPDETPQVVVVTPAAPNINFSVPTIGNLLVPNALAKAPPLAPMAPMRPVVPLKHPPATLENTGKGGDRPVPPYPRIALEQGQQGSVTLLLHANEAGIITTIEVKQSSGYPLLDRGAIDYVKRHWTVPTGSGEHVFEATITYRFQAG